MSVTRAKVYPVHELMEDCEQEDVPYLTPSFTNHIQPRYEHNLVYIFSSLLCYKI